MNLQIIKEDIKRIGHTTYNENGNTAFICNGDTSNIEAILLRNILKDFGDEYKIVSEKDYEGNDEFEIVFYTNLPFELYSSI